MNGARNTVALFGTTNSTTVNVMHSKRNYAAVVNEECKLINLCTLLYIGVRTKGQATDKLA